MVSEIIPFKEPRSLTGLSAKLPDVFLPDKRAAERFFGFFTANIRNKNTRRAYYKAACRFSEWCEGRGLLNLAEVKPPHVAGRHDRSRNTVFALVRYQGHRNRCNTD